MWLQALSKYIHTYFCPETVQACSLSLSVYGKRILGRIFQLLKNLLHIWGVIEAYFDIVG